MEPCDKHQQNQLWFYQLIHRRESVVRQFNISDYCLWSPSVHSDAPVHSTGACTVLPNNNKRMQYSVLVQTNICRFQTTVCLLLIKQTVIIYLLVAVFNLFAVVLHLCTVILPLWNSFTCPCIRPAELCDSQTRNINSCRFSRAQEFFRSSAGRETIRAALERFDAVNRDQLSERDGAESEPTNKNQCSQTYRLTSR